MSLNWKLIRWGQELERLSAVDVNQEASRTYPAETTTDWIDDR